jgi:hypothetical protein
MSSSPHTILAVIALILAVVSLAPYPTLHPYLIAVSVILLSIAVLIK